jgi:protein ImuA
MLTEKADIISRLQKDILLLQGFKPLPADAATLPRLGPIDAAFPDHSFPLASIHEFLIANAEDAAATSGFIACLLSSLMNNNRASAWISSSKRIFPPALKSFGIEPDKILFINSPTEKHILWIMEEALKCEGLAAVVCEIPYINFTASRRLQLAVEQSRVTGFIIRNQPGNLTPNACSSRWRISSLPSSSQDDLPGVGFPRWNIELLKIRNGKPGTWQLEWSGNKLHPVLSPDILQLQEQKRKTG